MKINNHKLKEITNISYYLYFLFNKNKLIYIGQTKSLNTRLVCHKRKSISSGTNQKKFDRYYAISSLSERITKKWEKILIKKLKPKYNIGHDKDAKYKKVWIKRKWSDERIKKYKHFQLRSMESICNSKQGYYKLMNK
jgi:predicted GIY-YIG superfamily endonuclease